MNENALVLLGRIRFLRSLLRHDVVFFNAESRVFILSNVHDYNGQFLFIDKSFTRLGFILNQMVFFPILYDNYWNFVVWYELYLLRSLTNIFSSLTRYDIMVYFSTLNPIIFFAIFVTVIGNFFLEKNFTRFAWS